MSRSVETLREAAGVIFLNWEGNVFGSYNPDTGEYDGEDFNEFETQDNWDCWKEELFSEALRARFPSLRYCKDWRDCETWARNLPGRETITVAHNDQVAVTISEYCGCIALSVIPRYRLDYRYHDTRGLQVRNAYYICRALRELIDALPGYVTRIRPIARASNGEVFYRAAN